MALPILAGAALGAIGGAAAGISSGIAIGAVIGGGIGASIHGTGQAADAASEQAQLYNEAAGRQLDYNTDLWEMQKDKIDADREQAVDVINNKSENEQTYATYQDTINTNKYLYDLQIRNQKQTSLNEQYLKSEVMYGLQNTLNYRSAEAAQDNEIRKLQEIKKEAAFDKQEQDIERLLAEGRIRARGQEGRSVGKTYQATVADYGRQAAQLAESIMDAGRNSRAVLEEIARDKKAADLAAFAKKMLHPGELPEPIQPLATPLTEWILPREVAEFDYGPAPTLGATMSPSAAASQVWGQGIASLGSMAFSAATPFIPTS